MLIIGITWTLGAGKWTVVDYLIQKHGFYHFSVRAYLIQKIEKKWLEVNRDSMVLVANELREKYWAGFIAEELYEQAKWLWKNAIIESIRCVGEIQSLKAKWPFYLFAVDADPSLRYDRITSRASETDHISYPVFISNEEREMQSDDPNKQNIRKCIALADYTFMNNGTMEELNHQVDEVMKKIS
jgi:dephospho-CoA kinase